MSATLEAVKPIPPELMRATMLCEPKARGPVPVIPDTMRFVVLAGVVAPIWDGVRLLPERHRGDVVSADDLGGDGQVFRLQNYNPPCIREANHFEATQARVDAGDQKKDVSSQELYYREKKRRESLEAQLAVEQANAASIRGMVGARPPAPAVNVQEIVIAKDDVIRKQQLDNDALRNTLASMAKQMEEQQAVTANMQAEMAALKSGQIPQPEHPGGNGGQGKGQRR